MKTLKLILIPLFLSSTAFAQSEFEAELDKQQSINEEDLSNQLTNKKKYQEILATNLKNLQDLKDKYANLETYEKNFEQSKITTLSSLNEKIKTLPLFQKIGAKASFYKCLRKSLEENGHLNYDTCNRNFFPALSDEEKARVSEWNEVSGKSLAEIAKEKNSIPEKIKTTEGYITTWEANLKWVLVAEERANTNLKSIEIKKEELKLIPKFADTIRCDSSATPEINLEEEVPYKGADFKGAFFGVPRDNQDGVGSCFANTAKNLLVGISEGKDVASFLDLALVYKDSNKQIELDALEGGNSCPTLNAAAKVGYCPQQFATFENGDRNLATEALFKLDPYTSMSYTISLTKEFINNVDALERNKDNINPEVLSRARDMIQAIKENPGIRIPLPVVRYKIPSDYKLQKLFKDNEATMRKLIPNIKEEDFLADYNELYKSFYPRYVKDVLAGKNLDEIFKTYTASLAPFYEKYNLAGNLPGIEKDYKANAEFDLNDKDFKKNLKASIDFLKKTLNRKDDSDAAFYEYCTDSGSDFLRFLSALQPLAEKIRTDKLNKEMLFTKDGKIKSALELMQLTIAPSCLNKENRKPLPAFICNAGYDTVGEIKKDGRPIEVQKRMLREKVVMSLAQGYPLGNEHPGDFGGFHINTIVGIRFNPETKSCEFRIRESQTGTSGWHDENIIFNKIMALTEVRRQK